VNRKYGIWYFIQICDYNVSVSLVNKCYQSGGMSRGRLDLKPHQQETANMPSRIQLTLDRTHCYKTLTTSANVVSHTPHTKPGRVLSGEIQGFTDMDTLKWKLKMTPGCSMLVRGTFAHCTYSVAGPLAWNSCTDYLQHSCQDAFRQHLKTSMFASY